MLFRSNKFLLFLLFLIIILIILIPEEKYYYFGDYKIEKLEANALPIEHSSNWPIEYLLHSNQNNQKTNNFFPIYVNDYFEYKGYLYFSYLDATGVGYEACFYSKKIYYGKLNINSGNLYLDISTDEIANLDYEFALQNKTKKWLEMDSNRCQT